MHAQNLKHKRALIIGSMNELALGVGVTLHAAGSPLILAGAEEPSAGVEDAALSLGATTYEVDMDDPLVLAGQIDSMPPIHVAVLNPGWYAVREFMDTGPEDWDQAVCQNFERMVYASQATAKAMIRHRRGGRILFLSSFSGVMPSLQTSVAGTTLSALEAVARMAAVDLGPHGITVNVVVVGWLEADWARPYLKGDDRAFVEQGIPVGRTGRAEDVGAVCCFLASDAASYVTGAVIPVDGGYALSRAEGTSPYPQSAAQ